MSDAKEATQSDEDAADGGRLDAWAARRAAKAIDVARPDVIEAAIAERRDEVERE